jgi:hypothetical protein
MHAKTEIKVVITDLIRRLAVHYSTGDPNVPYIACMYWPGVRKGSFCCCASLYIPASDEEVALQYLGDVAICTV